MIELSPRPGPAPSFRASALSVTPLLLRVAVVMVLALGAVSPAVAGWWDAAAEAREVTLAELRRAPEKWRDVPVLLRVEFTARGERTNPYFTQFSAERWRPVTVDVPRTEVETQRGAPASFERLFVRRGGAEDRRLPSLRPGRDMLVRAVVRDVVGGEPWLEVLSITLDGDPLTAEERTRVKAADRFLSRANPAAAEKLYRAVLEARDLEGGDRAAVLRKLGVALHDQRRGTDALAAFREALTLDPDHVDTRTRVAAIEENLARTPVPVREPAVEAPVRETPRGHAGRAAPSAPEPPLYLPGGRQKLAPPSGLVGQPSDEPPASDPPPADTARGATGTGKTTPKLQREPRKPTPSRSAPRGTVTKKDATGAADLPPVPLPATQPPVNPPESDAGRRPTEEEGDAEETEEETPPPVPARPVLSGPK